MKNWLIRLLGGVTKSELKDRLDNIYKVYDIERRPPRSGEPDSYDEGFEHGVDAVVDTLYDDLTLEED